MPERRNKLDRRFAFVLTYDLREAFNIFSEPPDGLWLELDYVRRLFDGFENGLLLVSACSQRGEHRRSFILVDQTFRHHTNDA
ncbi:hypothetical protein [Sinorhizobium sp. RAC02]|uniref:hypothetical protein n=1 Tax=Sinorhizobium sp. RAC02 TaxID=1842534 RepID=UPI00257004D1|nr:hypothetical protein [Sinorhizobium sp. RAC02]